MDAGVLGGPLDLLPALPLRAKGDVALQGVGEQEALLGHVGDVPPEHGQGNLIDGPAVDADHVAFGVVQPQQQAGQGTLAAAGAAQDRQGAPPVHVDPDGVQHRHVLLVRVGEGQPVKVDLPLQGRHVLYLRPVHDLRLLVQDGADPLEAGRALGDEGDALAGGQHGPDQHGDVQVEGLELAQGDLPGDGEVAAVEEGQQAADADNQIQQGHEEGL